MYTVNVVNRMSYFCLLIFLFLVGIGGGCGHPGHRPGYASELHVQSG